MNADEGSPPIVSSGIDDQAHADQPTPPLASPRFWNKKHFVWNNFNSVVCSPWEVAGRQTDGARAVDARGLIEGLKV